MTNGHVTGVMTVLHTWFRMSAFYGAVRIMLLPTLVILAVISILKGSLPTLVVPAKQLRSSVAQPPPTFYL